jgi:transposase
MFAGIDVSKKWVDVALSDSLCSLNRVNPIKAAKWLKKQGVTLAVLEATGGYELPVMHALAKEKISVARVNPRQARSFADAFGKRSKTDALDAKNLALYAKMLQPQPTNLPAKHLQSLRELCSYRQDLVTMRTAENNRLKQQSDTFISKQIQQLIKVIERSVDKVEQEIKKILTENIQLNELFTRLCTMPGIGFVTAVTLIAYMPELGDANSNEIAALAGVAPFTRQSGTWKGKSFCSGGRAIVRQAIYMATISAIRGKNRFAMIYKNFREKGKPAKVAIAAVMRKMLVTLNAMIYKKSDFLQNIT